MSKLCVSSAFCLNTTHHPYERRTFLVYIADPRQPRCQLPVLPGGTVSDCTHIYLDLFPVRVLDGRVIAFYPYILHKLRCSPHVPSASLCTSFVPPKPRKTARSARRYSPVKQLFPTPPAPRTTMWYSLLPSTLSSAYDPLGIGTLLNSTRVDGLPRAKHAFEP